MAKEVEVKIRGIADYLQHRRPPKPEEDKEEGNRTSGEVDYSKEAEKATYQESKIGCYIPAKQIQACLIKSGVDFKIKGKSRKTYKDRMNAAIVVTPDKIPFSPSKEKPDYIHEDWGRIPPKTGNMVWLTRPAYKAGWKVNFKLLILDDQIPLKTLEEILVNAGQFYGIGDWRPRFGRFEVIEFAENHK